MKSRQITKDDIIDMLADIPDPEVPVINIVELGIVRDAAIDGDEIVVKITPTYSGCPAMNMIERQIVDHLSTHGLDNVSIKTVYAPAWTTDWITEEAKQKLKDYGIAPPGMVMDQDLFDFKPRPVSCPQCDSDDTKRQSEFGSTPCKSQYFCNNCHQPFEHFKCH